MNGDVLRPAAPVDLFVAVAVAVAVPVAVAVAVAGCGHHVAARPKPALVPRALGRGPAYRPPIRASPKTCSPVRGARYGAHLELFAYRRVVLVPAGIGVAPPLRTDGPYVRAGACYAAAITREPTGVIEVAPAAHAGGSSVAAVPTLKALFALWGQPLEPTRLAGFAGQRVSAFVGGARRSAPPASIRLTRHAEIVLEVGGYVAPHIAYRFPPGL